MKLAPNQQTCVDDPTNEPPTLQCGANSFSCSNGKCVPQSYRCDGADDCYDQSDEAGCGTHSNASLFCSTELLHGMGAAVFLFIAFGQHILYNIPLALFRKCLKLYNFCKILCI